MWWGLGLYVVGLGLYVVGLGLYVVGLGLYVVGGLYLVGVRSVCGGG